MAEVQFNTQELLENEEVTVQTQEDVVAEKKEESTEETPKVDVPTQEESPKVEVPTQKETPKESPKLEVPTEEETPKVEVPTEEETPKVAVPTEEETPKVEVPTEEETPEVEVPTQEETPAAETPAEQEMEETNKENSQPAPVAVVNPTKRVLEEKEDEQAEISPKKVKALQGSNREVPVEQPITV